MASGVPYPFQASLKDELGPTSSFSSLRNGRRSFLSLSLLFMIWISQLSIRVLGGARGLPGKHFLASPPSLQSLQPPLWYPFSPAPHGHLGNKAHCFSPLYACASPRAAPTCCACALLPKLGWGKRKGRRDWRAGERPRGAFCNRPRACIFLIPFLPFLGPHLPLIFSCVVSHVLDRRALRVLGTPAPGGF